MSQLSTNTTLIDECISIANTLPDAGGGGGGSIETCTIKYSSASAYEGANSYWLEVDETGKLVTKNDNFIGGSMPNIGSVGVTELKVPCNSFVLIGMGSVDSATVTNGGSVVYKTSNYFVLTAPSTAGVICELTVVRDV